MNDEHVDWKIISEPRGIVSANVNNSNPSLSSIIHHCLPVALYLSHIWRPSTFWLSANFHRKSVLLGISWAPITEDQIFLDDQLLWEKSNQNMKSAFRWNLGFAVLSSAWLTLATCELVIRQLYLLAARLQLRLWASLFWSGRQTSLN